LMASVNFFQEDKIIRYLKDITLLLIWLSSLIIAIATAARQIPAERESRTIFPLLAKPVSRWQVVLGKFLGCWVACGIALVVFYLFFGIVSGAKEGHLAVLPYLQAFWLHWAMLAIVVAMVLLGSVTFTAPSSNATISFVVIAGIFILGSHLHKLAGTQPPPIAILVTLLYFILPHLEWFYSARERLVFDQGLIAWSDCVIATVYVACYVALFLFLTWVCFRRKVLATT